MQHIRYLLGLHPTESRGNGTGLDQSLPQPNQFSRRMIASRHSGGWPTSPEWRPTYRNPAGNEMMKTK